MFFYIWHWKHWKRYCTFIAILIFMGSAFFINQKKILPVFSSENTVAYSKGDATKKHIALTFNISWGENKLSDILYTLKDQATEATFFVSGEWAERHPDELKQIVEDGHELGMLGYRYQSYFDLRSTDITQDLYQAKKTFKDLGFDQIRLLRPPNGHFNKNIIQQANELGLTVVHWSVNPNDWENPGTQHIVNFVSKTTSNGDIVLLHASDSAKQTKNALQSIIPSFKEKNFSFVTASEIIHGIETNYEALE